MQLRLLLCKRCKLQLRIGILVDLLVKGSATAWVGSRVKELAIDSAMVWGEGAGSESLELDRDVRVVVSE